MAHFTSWKPTERGDPPQPADHICPCIVRAPDQTIMGLITPPGATSSHIPDLFTNSQPFFSRTDCKVMPCDSNILHPVGPISLVAVPVITDKSVPYSIGIRVINYYIVFFIKLQIN